MTIRSIRGASSDEQVQAGALVEEPTTRSLLRSKEMRFWLALVALCGGAIILLLVVTRWGIGLSPDSAIYIAGARSLLEGHGISFPLGGGRWQPITAWPPFYSIVLAVLGLPGVDPWIGARFLNAVLLGANAILTALILRRVLGGGEVIPFLGALLFLLSGDSLSAHGWAWSDALFVFLGFLGLLFLDAHLEKGRQTELIVAGLLIGLCTYTRYIGIAFVITGLTAIGFRGGTSISLKRKVSDFAIFGALACLPIAAWSIRNLTLAANLGGDIVGTRGIPPGDWAAVYQIVSLWFIPGRIPETARDGLMVALTGLFVVLTISAVGRAGWMPKRGSVRLARTILLFVVVYVAILIGTRLSFRAFNIRDARYYLPIYMGLVILFLIDLRWLHVQLVSGLSRWKEARAKRAGWVILQAGWAVAFVAIAAFHGVQAAKWARESYSEGMGYANESWHSSEMMDSIRRLPEGAPLLSNAFDAVYVLTGRVTYPFPRSADAAIPTGLTYAEEWERTIFLVQEEGALLAAFHRATRRGHVGIEDVAGAISICAIWRYNEGGIYGKCPGK